MAAGTVTIMRRAMPKLSNGTLDLDTQSIKLALTTSVQALTDDFAGASTDCRYADLTAEVVGTGYTAGGTALANVTWTRSAATVTFDADDVSWATSTITARYGVLYADGATNKDIIAYFLLDSAPADVSTTAGTFLVSWNASGIFTYTKSP